MSEHERVLFLLESLGAGGAEVATVNLVRALVERGHWCGVASLMPPDTLADRFSEAGAEVYELSLGHRWRVDQAQARLTKLLRRTKPTVLHAQLFFAGFYSATARLGAPALKRVVTFQNLGYDSYPPHGVWLRTRRQLDRLAMDKGVDTRVAVSHAVADHYQRHLGITFDDVIPNGIDARGLAAATPPTREEILGGLGIPDRPLVVCPARFVHEKGHRFLIEAVAGLHTAGHDVVLVLAGEGPLRGKVEEQVNAAGIREHVRFIGSIPNMQLMDLLRVGETVVLPSTHEGFPVVVAEAAATGAAIVATSVGGVPEFLEDGVSGILVPPSQPTALGRAIGQLLGSSADRRRLGESAQKHALAVCDAQIVASRYERIYRRSLR